MTHHELTFKIVGPMLVCRDGAAVPLPRSTVLRGLLGMLVLADGAALPAGRLAGAVWTHNRDAGTKGAVQVGVSRLRSWLHRCGLREARVEHDGDGYRLVAPGAEVDLRTFRAWQEAARETADAGQRFDLLRRAVMVRRGPVLADLTTVDTADALLRLANETVREGVLAFGSAALEAGRATDAVAHLESLVEAAPFDEPAHARLIELLAATDRPAAALMRYEALRARLAEELGVAPGEAVQRAHLAVLATDRTLVEAPATGANAAVPAQLPIAVAGFAGRRGELASLDACVPADGAGASVVVIAGPAGVGKSTLATHWAHRMRDRFPGGQLYANLRGHAAEPAATGEVLAGFLHALGEPAGRIPPDPDEAAAMFRTQLADRRTLMLLDDAHDVAQVRPLLPAGAGSVVVITSRALLGGLVAREGAQRIVLDVLEEADARTLLAEHLGAERVAAEPRAVTELVHACASLPLALRIAAANVGTGPAGSIAAYVRRLRSGDRLAALHVDGDEHSAVRATFDQSYSTLPGPSRLMFRRFGLLPGTDVTAEAAAALAGVPPDEAGRTLDRLTGVALLTRPAPERYTCHDLLRLYAAERAGDDSPAQRRAATGRYLRWCMDGVDAAALCLYPGTFGLARPDRPTSNGSAGASGASASSRTFADSAAALSWLDSERANLVAAIVFAAEHGPLPVASWLADALRRYFWFRESPVDRHTVAAAGLAAAEATGDPRARAAGHMAMAEWHQIRSEYPDAITHFTAAAELSTMDGWAEGQATAAGGLAYVYWQTGQLRPAAEHAEAALGLCRRLGSDHGQSSNLGRLGMANFAMGRLVDASRCHRDALALARRTGNRVNEAYSLGHLGQTVHAMGLFDEALGLLDEAVAMQRESGNRLAQGDALTALAAVHHDRGDLSRAASCALAALDIATDLGERRIEADARNRLGDVARRRDEAGALDQHRRAAELAAAAGATCAWVAAQIGLAWAHHRAGADDAALACAERAGSRARAGGYRLLDGLALTAQAAALRGSGRPADARMLAERALDLHGETGYRVGATGARDELDRLDRPATHASS